MTGVPYQSPSVSVATPALIPTRRRGGSSGSISPTSRWSSAAAWSASSVLRSNTAMIPSPSPLITVPRRARTTSPATPSTSAEEPVAGVVAEARDALGRSHQITEEDRDRLGSAHRAPAPLRAPLEQCRAPRGRRLRRAGSGSGMRTRYSFPSGRPRGTSKASPSSGVCSWCTTAAVLVAAHVAGTRLRGVARLGATLAGAVALVGATLVLETLGKAVVGLAPGDNLGLEEEGGILVCGLAWLTFALVAARSSATPATAPVPVR